MNEFSDNKDFTLFSCPVISEESTLSEALVGCDAVIAILLSVQNLKATTLVQSLIKTTKMNNVNRVIFTAGEVTSIYEEGEKFTLRQNFLLMLGKFISLITYYSMIDMINSSALIKQNNEWNWTIIRAPTLHDKPVKGYQFCKISDISMKDSLSREDYASCLLDSIGNTNHYKRILTIISISPES